MDENNNYFDLDSVNAQSERAVQSHNGNLNNRKDDKTPFIAGIVVGLAAALVIVSIVMLVGRVSRNSAAQNQSSLNSGMNAGNAAGIAGSDVVTAEVLKKLGLLTGIIEDEFYLHEVSGEELAEGMYRGLLDSLDDRYSEYYNAEEFQELMNGTSGIYYGIGAYVSLDTATNYPKISGTIKGTPAEEAGLRANDILYEVDGTSTYGMTLTDAVALIKGEENTPVVLSIVRDGKQLEFTLYRRKVESPTVESKMLDDKMGYLQITEFDDVTTDQFLAAMEELYAAGMEGLVLDLRSNPGGNLSTVVEIAQNLLPEGVIVYTEDKAGKRVNYRSKGDREIQIPMTVLVDMNSASAAEILSGAIQDYGKGTLIGTTTFGKGIVQSIIPLYDGSAVKITISSYYTPKGRNIHGIGIEPDIVCEFDGEHYYDVDDPVDNQLEKAKEVLAGMMK